MIAAQEKKAGLNNQGRNRKNLNLTDIAAIANSTNSSLMQANHDNRKKQKVPGEMIRQPKYPKGVAVS